LLPALGAARRTARQMANNTQLRGIHQGFVTFAQSNKKGGNDGYFPTLDGSGNTATTPAAVANDTYGAGAAINAKIGLPPSTVAIMLNGNFFTPDYVVNPADAGTTEAALDTVANATIDGTKFSYAMLDLGTQAAVDADPLDPGRAIEWKETLNTSAIIISDKNTGADAVIGTAVSSVWTEEDSGDWRGGVTKNDNSTSFETTPEFEQTKYGNNIAVTTDNIFADVGGGGAGQDTYAAGGAAGSNAAMVTINPDAYVAQ
ncbi:MAG: hypothetical protein AAF086_09430, partial [Planctomycetota bacterium]